MVTAGCQTAGPGPGEARLSLGAGDGIAGVEGNGTLLHRGAIVRATRGEPSLELSHGRRVTLRPGSAVQVGDPIGLVAGDVLITGTEAVAVDAGAAAVRGVGAVRVARSLASSVRVYSGSAVVSSVGRSVKVDARREASVPAVGLVPPRASWITWDRGDDWDVRYLGTVIDLSDQLDAGSRSFASAAGDATASDVAGLLPEVPADAWAAALSQHPRGEAFVGGAITAASGVDARVGDVMVMRESGAAWGVVAVERAKGDAGRAVELVYGALGRWAGRSRHLAAGPIPGGASSSAPSASTSAAAGGELPRGDIGTGSGSGSDGSAGGSGGSSPSPAPAVPPVTTPTTPSAPSSPAPTVPDPVGALLGGVIGKGSSGGTSLTG